MNRQPGYYWVKFKLTDKEHYIAKWNGKYWQLHGETFPVTDKSFFKIYPDRLIEPGEWRNACFSFDWEALIMAVTILALMVLFSIFL